MQHYGCRSRRCLFISRRANNAARGHRMTFNVRIETKLRVGGNLARMLTNPSNNHFRVSVGWKDRIDTVRYASLPDDEREALEQAHALHLEARQPEACCELAVSVTQQLERQAQSAHRLPLVVRELGAQAIDD